jgi:hypothetical protein
MKLAVTPGWPLPYSTDGPPCTISARSMVSSRRNIEEFSMNDSVDIGYSGVPFN